MASETAFEPAPGRPSAAALIALGTALAYAVVGAVALLLAGPPGYASPLYPPAGIALAAVICYGRAAFGLLGLQTYFTAGVKEVRAWTIHIGDTAPQAAGVIHTDFERGFIRAQTIAYEDFIAFKGEQGAKDHGKMRAEGKEYVVKDGDVMNFLFNV